MQNAPFIMDQYASVDVDNAFLDFKFAEVLLKEKSNVQKIVNQYQSFKENGDISYECLERYIAHLMEAT